MERLLQCLIIESPCLSTLYSLSNYPLSPAWHSIGSWRKRVHSPAAQAVRKKWLNDGKSEDKKKGDHYDWSNSFVCWNNAGGVSQWMHGVLLFPVGFFNVQQSESLLLSYCIKILNGILVCVHIIVASIPFLHYNSHTCVFPYAWSQSQSRKVVGLLSTFCSTYICSVWFRCS